MRDSLSPKMPAFPKRTTAFGTITRITRIFVDGRPVHTHSSSRIGKVIRTRTASGDVWEAEEDGPPSLPPSHGATVLPFRRAA